MRRNIFCIILAGGTGTRFGSITPKQFVNLNGKPLLYYSTATVSSSRYFDHIVIVSHSSTIQTTYDIIKDISGTPITVISGGETRNQSTIAGINALKGQASDIVLIHDAARPLLSLKIIHDTIQCLQEGVAEAVDVVIPVSDTLVIVKDNIISDIPDRSIYRRGQTPQGFLLGVIRDAYDHFIPGTCMTDDCGVVLRYLPDIKIHCIYGDDMNMKVTNPNDILMVSSLLRNETHVFPDATKSIHGRRIVVIGGTSGIGKELCNITAAKGAYVKAYSRRTGHDITNVDNIHAILKDARTSFGGIDDVVITAAIFNPANLLEYTENDIKNMIDTNLTSVLLIAKASYPYLAESKGSLTIFSSSSYRGGRPLYSVYSSTKCVIVNIVESLSQEWKDVNISVNAICPERTNTPMRTAMGEDKETLLDPINVANNVLKVLMSSVSNHIFICNNANSSA
jgi:2-C-methyl-D-erythritol 4-phosphate cytidylyltransferase